MTFELTILGSGSALPTSRRYPTAQAVNVLERFFLIDCGEGTQLQLRKSKIRLAKLNNIFISHVHGDHVFGLFGLLSTFNLLGRKTELKIFGPQALKEILYFYIQNFTEELQYKIVFNPVDGRTKNLIFEDKVSEVYSFPLKHRVPTFGYLIREKEKLPNIRKEAIEKYNLGVKDILSIKEGNPFHFNNKKIDPESLIIPSSKPRSYAYCSDTAYYERIIPWIKGVDLLYHEATFQISEKKIARQTLHSTASQAATIAKKAGVKKLLLGHFSNRYAELDSLLKEAQSIFPESYIVEDLDVYSVPENK
ncbi:MAG: ribonuclease Z [Bacteroidales bacterium]|nr:ribonuclease Z [Bacteroidales bacterium]MBN2818233.1 ribonuclease Z [Bacteroidales bacterium]